MLLNALDTQASGMFNSLDEIEMDNEAAYIKPSNKNIYMISTIIITIMLIIFTLIYYYYGPKKQSRSFESSKLTKQFTKEELRGIANYRYIDMYKDIINATHHRNDTLKEEEKKAIEAIRNNNNKTNQTLTAIETSPNDIELVTLEDGNIKELILNTLNEYIKIHNDEYKTEVLNLMLAEYNYNIKELIPVDELTNTNAAQVIKTIDDQLDIINTAVWAETSSELYATRNSMTTSTYEEKLHNCIMNLKSMEHMIMIMQNPSKIVESINRIMNNQINAYKKIDIADYNSSLENNREKLAKLLVEIEAIKKFQNQLEDLLTINKDNTHVYTNKDNAIFKTDVKLTSLTNDGKKVSADNQSMIKEAIKNLSSATKLSITKDTPIESIEDTIQQYTETTNTKLKEEQELNLKLVKATKIVKENKANTIKLQDAIYKAFSTTVVSAKN